MAHTLKIPRSWYERMDKIHSLNYQPIISNELLLINHGLGESLYEFIKWASLRRVHYLPNIELEIETFKSGDIGNVRMYNTNVDEWKKIQSYVFKMDNYTCQYCKNKGGVLEVDHKVPFSKGGSDDYENLITACQKCNRQKRDKSVSEFIEWRTKNENKNNKA